MNEKLQFSKMHGLGNDFVVIDTDSQAFLELTVPQRRFIADRHLGIGCDQILLVEKAQQTDIDFKYRIFNADGGEVSQCGNGARCFGRFVYEKGLTEKNEIRVETHSGLITLHIKDNGDKVSVDMGEPRWSPGEIPINMEQQALYQIPLADGEAVTVSAVSMGNPHAVLLVDDVINADVEKIGPQIEGHSLFPERVNAGFMEIIRDNEVKLRVYERGTGETQACGTGACAAVVAGIQKQILKEKVTVHLTGGDLEIEWKGLGHPVWMTGAATHVFDGEIAWATIAAQ